MMLKYKIRFARYVSYGVSDVVTWERFGPSIQACLEGTLRAIESEYPEVPCEVTSIEVMEEN